MIAQIVPGARPLPQGGPGSPEKGGERGGRRPADSDMHRCVSPHDQRLDTKGRVSVPASFRAVLVRDGFEGLYCYPALDRPALDAGGNGLLAEIEALIARFPPYSEQREQFSLA